MDLWLLPSAAAMKSLSLAGFDQLSRRADALPPAEPGLDGVLREAFGWTCAAPWAALLAGADGDSSTPWLAADLVHVRPEMSGARVLALAIDHDAADPDLPTLFSALQPWLADEAIELVAASGGRALLRCPISHGDPATIAPDALLGSDLRAALPLDLRWQRRLNEMQMVLAQQSCNDARAARGLPSWNTLWFWGQGSADSCPPLPLVAVSSVDPLLAALARHQGVAMVDVDGQSAGPVLRDLRDPRRLVRAWAAGLRPRDALLRGVDGSGWRVRGWQRWRVWR
ncbi:MAG: hypothetical protein IPO66_06700 [Rhodanobacteraceae bacterium]|nr:hypothetical protein [Rhodanobacteraceae bacterium]